MNKSSLILRLTLLVFLALFIISCQTDQKKNLAPPEITVVKALQKDVPVYREFVGQVYGSSDIPIRARVSGFLEGIHFQEGSNVKHGQLLYTIDKQPFEAKLAAENSALAEANTSLAKAESDLNRIKPLAEIKAVSESDLDAAVAQYDAAQAYVEAAKASVELAQIELGYCSVYSPISGLIGKTNAKVGEFVGQTPNPVILNTVSITDSVVVEFFLSESDFIGLAKQIIDAHLTGRAIDNENFKPDISLILADGSDFAYKGTVNFIDRSIDPSTGSLLVQTAFPNPNKLLRPGLYAKVRVKMDEKDGAILVPQRCVSELQGQYSVFVVNDSSKVEARQIKAGVKVDDYWLIEEGLKPNENVVIDALQKVGSGMTVEPKVIEFKSKFNSQN